MIRWGLKGRALQRSDGGRLIGKWRNSTIVRRGYHNQVALHYGRTADLFKKLSYRKKFVRYYQIQPELSPAPEKSIESFTIDTPIIDPIESHLEGEPIPDPTPKPSPPVSNYTYRQPHTVLIDGSPIMYANFFKITENLCTVDGIPTNALHGFMRALGRIINELDQNDPYDFIGICVDSTESFRKKLVSTYKSTRKTPEGLKTQLQLLEDASWAMGIVPVKLPGYEADDIIATYSRRAEENGHKVTIYTPDKDLLQVISNNVIIRSTKSDNRDIFDLKRVREEWGVEPYQIPHVQALIGDSVDNIQKIPTMNLKRAAQLIREYGTIQNLLDKRDASNNPLSEIIKQNASIIEQNFILTKMVDDLEKIPPLDDLRKKPPDREMASSFCLRFDLSTIITWLEKVHKWKDTKTEPDFPEVHITPEMNPKEVRELIHKNMPGVTFVNDKESAEEVIKILYQYKDRYHACDTEATDIDVRTQSPIGCGRVISASVYVGPDANFGNGPRIFIDNLEPYEDTIQYFKEYFEDPTIYKVWHNYSFDRHMMYNHGINVQGFGGDTMHMARLENASRVSFSLESLSKEILLNSKHKRGMLERFGEYPTKKDGDPAKDMRLAPFHEIQRNPKKLCAWIDYSTLDTDSTWHLREALHRRLNLMPWEPEKSTMWDFYQHLWAPFGELLTDMEREGIKVDVPYLAEILPKAYEDKKALEDKFLQWAEKMCPDCKYMNAHSDAQKQQLLFAPTRNSKKKLEMPPTREFKVPNVLNKSEVFWKWQNEINEWSTFDTSTNNTLETLLKEIVPDIDTAEYNELIEKIPQDTEPIEITLNGRPCWLSMKDLTYTDIESFHVHKIKRMVNKPKKDMTINIKGLGLAYTEITISGWPSVSSSTISRLAGNPPKSYGAAKMLMEKQGHNGEEACEALSSLTKANAVETLINSFISPLPTMTDQNHRIHCSLNLNTETGRLSSRKPNLQNQPALDKDTYKIRKAYTCEKGNTLIVADYGQLELRLLAHVSNCKSMIDAFKSGGDFHSRTALGMYPAIQEAINSGKVLLEWDSTKGKSPVPLLKDAFGTERRRAKTLNFSIAYGKTVHGLAKDWSVSTEEAKDTLEKWYADRPEVRLWQQKMIAYAKVTGYTRTLLGRYRKLAPLINSDVKSLASHAERAAINTPLQGGAADIVTRAMILLHRSEKLKKMGWKQLLQIHDELIFEGPAESAEEAKDHIVQVMEHPLEYPLLIDLIVDAKTADNWYAAK